MLLASLVFFVRVPEFVTEGVGFDTVGDAPVAVVIVTCTVGEPESERAYELVTERELVGPLLLHEPVGSLLAVADEVDTIVPEAVSVIEPEAELDGDADAVGEGLFPVIETSWVTLAEVDIDCSLVSVGVTDMVPSCDRETVGVPPLGVDVAVVSPLVLLDVVAVRVLAVTDLSELVDVDFDGRKVPENSV